MPDISAKMPVLPWENIEKMKPLQTVLVSSTGFLGLDRTYLNQKLTDF